MRLFGHTLAALLMLNVFTVLGVAQDGILGSATESDKTGRVYDLLADYQFASDEFNRERHCLVATGSVTRHNGNETRESGINYLSVKESGGDRLIASSIVVPSSTGRVMERWNQRILKNGKVYLRGSPYSNREMETFDADDDRLRERRDWAVDLRPFALALTLPIALESGRGPTRPAENFLADGNTLLDAKYLDSKDIVATFLWEPASTEEASIGTPTKVITAITFSKSVNYLPAFYSISFVLGGKQHLAGTVTTQWQKVRETWMPVAYEGKQVSLSGRENHYRVNCRYKVGKDMPKGLIDVDLPDWREPIRVLFQAEWQRQGVRPPFVDSAEEE